MSAPTKPHYTYKRLYFRVKYLRKFYIIIEKGATLWHQLFWSHLEIIMIKKENNIIMKYCSNNRILRTI